MHLIINYSSAATAEVTPDVLLLAAACLSPDRHQEAVAIDGLRMIFQTLEEASVRLDSKLSEQKTRTFPKEPGLVISHEQQVAYTSIMAEVWILIDNIRRIELLVNFVPNIATSLVGAEFQVVLKEVKELRDSLHHINERVNKYFAARGESIVGNIFWRYRKAPGITEELNCLFSGIRRIDVGTVHLGQPQEERFLERLGNYDLRISYVRDPYNPITKKRSGKIEEVEVNLENAIQVVNRLILVIHQKYIKVCEKALSAPESMMTAKMLPTIFTIRLKQEAWDAKNPPSNKLSIESAD
ncbi:MAG TPA: hypothetical protein VF690_03210 [Hymenobacter sp.]